MISARGFERLFTHAQLPNLRDLAKDRQAVALNQIPSERKAKFGPG
jgi:hypothetical protein